MILSLYSIDSVLLNVVIVAQFCRLHNSEIILTLHVWEAGMSIQELIAWLENCPVLQGEKLNWNYLPSYSGWSLAIPQAETRTDILGNRRELRQLKITRRYTVQSNEDRLAAVDELENLAAWAKANPPEHARLKVAGLPEFTSRNNYRRIEGLNFFEDLIIVRVLRDDADFVPHAPVDAFSDRSEARDVVRGSDICSFDKYRLISSGICIFYIVDSGRNIFANNYRFFQN